ncbi:MAG: hypothetical protein KKD35_03810 [Elusimicrobia bacterium]|nr:hypothetical protein [Elusimicrobiota bacterium]
MNKLISTLFLITTLNISTSASMFDTSTTVEDNTLPSTKMSTVLLWMPALDFSLETILDELETDSDLKITLAVSEPINDQDLKRLNEFSKAGRVEIIMRMTNNPIIGLFYYPKNISPLEKISEELKYSNNNPFFFAQRLTAARKSFIENLKDFPMGFANSPGDIFPDYIPLARSIELKWIATGPLISTSSYETLNCEGINIVPFNLFKSSETYTLKENTLNFIVYDETLHKQTEEADNASILNFLASHKQQFLTVSQALNIAISTPIARTAVSDITLPWTENYSPWTSNRQQLGLLSGLEKTREEILRFIGLNQTKTKQTNHLLTAFYEIESGPQLIQLLETPGETSTDIELDLQNKLAKIYRTMEKNLPPWLFKSFTELSPENIAAIVQISSGTNFINLKNSLNSKLSSTKKNETISSAISRIAEMNITWDKEEIAFYLRPELINDEEEFSLENIEIDIYIDINNRMRAGRTRALRGNKINILPQDAWEYSISLNNEKATINYAGMSGIKNLYSIETTKEKSGFKIAIPRKILQGNPLRWGYSAIIFSDKSAKEFTDKLSSNEQTGYLSSIRPGEK